MKYNKPKDQYLAALFVAFGFIALPLTFLWYLLVGLKDAIVGGWRDLRYEFKGGPIVTAAYAHRLAMESFASRRARRERERKG